MSFCLVQLIKHADTKVTTTRIVTIGLWAANVISSLDRQFAATDQARATDGVRFLASPLVARLPWIG